jgi:tRNA (guanine26-N2/guanine27-N2)-dimethyltransferase
MVLYSCDQGCGSFQTQYLVKNKVAENKKGSGHFYKHTLKQGPTADEHCAHCDTKTHINGPVWGGPLHSPDFIRRLLGKLPDVDRAVYGTIPRLEGMLQTALEEDLPFPEGSFTPVNPRDDAHAAIEPYPFYVDPHKVASVLCAVGPSTDMFRGALTHLGYRHTRSHCRPGSVKTDAPWSTIWWVLLEWIRQKAPITPKNVRPRTAGFRILEKAGILKLNEAGEVVAAGRGAVVKDGQDVQMEDGEPGETATSDPDAVAAELTTDAKIEDVQAEQEDTAAPETDEDNAAAAFKEEELRKTLVFNEDLAALGRRNQGKKKLVRYQTNPRANWGPMVKAKTH